MRTVFVNVDTQIDFLYPAGALYVPGAERLVPVIAGLLRHAAGSGIPVISTMDAHAENDPEFNSWPPHCVAGTLGQRKPEATLLARGAAGQHLVAKNTLDAFSNPNLCALLDRLGAERCVVYGVATEYCVRLAVLNLLRTGLRVDLVVDAIAGVRDEDARRALAELESAGATLTTTATILA